MAKLPNPKKLAQVLRKELERKTNRSTQKALALIEAGANPFFKWTRFPIDEISILGVAIQNHSEPAIIAALLKKAGMIERCSRGGWSNTSPLKLAVECRHAGAVSVLLGAGERDDILWENIKKNPACKDLLPLFEEAHHKDVEKIKAAALASAQKQAEIDAALEATRQRQTPHAWSLPAADKIMHTELTPTGKSRLMDVFNFSTRERTLITENLQTGVESPSAPVSFDAVNRDVLQKALDEFTRLGGVAGDNVFRKKSSSCRNFEMDKKEADRLGAALYKELNRGEEYDADKALLLIAQGANPHWNTAWNGTTLIHKAINQGRVPIVEALIDKGVDPFHYLYAAVISKHPDVIKAVFDKALSQKPRVFQNLKENWRWKKAEFESVRPLLEDAARREKEIYSPEKKPPPEWSRPAPDTLWHATPLSDGQTLTDIFNFTTRERILVSPGVITTAGFGSVGKDVLKQACDEFQRLGGTVAPDILRRWKLVKLPAF